MGTTKCPHCRNRLGDFLYANFCPHCHRELAHNTVPLAIHSLREPVRKQGWFIGLCLKVRNLIES